MRFNNSNDFNLFYAPKYNEFFNLVLHTGNKLNSRKNRFDKADLFEAAFSQSTRGILKWVDEEGCDLQCSKTQTRFEMKSQQNCLFTPKTQALKAFTKEIKLTNTLQQGMDKKLNNTSDYLILVDSGNGSSAVGIISYQKVIEEFSIEKSDGFACKIPMEEVTILYTPRQFKPYSVTKETYADAKRKLQETYIKDFFRGSYGI